MTTLTSIRQTGQKSDEGNLKDGKLVGFWTFWYDNGKKASEGSFKDGRPYGLVTEWHENGQKESEVTYKEVWKKIDKKCWDEDGNETECD